MTTGALELQGRAPTAASETGESTAVPGLGALEVQGRTPSLLPYLSADALPDVGAITLEGRIAAEWRELKITLAKEYPFPVAGSASPGVGYLATAGQAPFAATEMTVSPSFPTAAGDQSEMPPTLLRTLAITPVVGALSALGRLPTTQKFVTVITQFIEPELGALAIEYPELEVSFQAVRPGLATLTLDGRSVHAFATAEPGLATLTVSGREVTARILSDPTTGALTVDGLAADLWLERRVEPGLGELALSSPAPGYSTEIGAGELAVAGLTPDLYAERIVTPDVGALSAAGQAADETRDALAEGSPGLLTLEGLTPFLVRYVGDSVPVDPTPETLTVQGLEPTIVSGDVLGGSSIKRRRRGRVRAPIETSATATVVVALEPDIAAHYDEPPEMLGGVDTRRQAAEVASITARVEVLEAEAARRARMRREEEELIQILLRVA